MTIKLNGVTADSTASTALDYAIDTNPSPLQISSTGSISITVSKAVPPAVQCTSLVFGVSKGTAAANLTTDPSTISTQCPSEWSVTLDHAGNFTFTYQGSGEIGQDGLLFVLDNIAVNDQVGTSHLSITENLQSGTNNGSLPLPKFPVNFTVSDLTADSYSISPGGHVNLSWNGSAGGNYSLSYNGSTVSDLPNVDTYPVNDLQETTTFTLTVIAEGGTIQLVRQCIVNVEQPVIEEFGVVGIPAGNLAEVPMDSSFQLYWQTVNVDHCTLLQDNSLIGTDLPANMSEEPGYAVTAPPTPGGYTYTLIANSSSSKGTSPSATLPILVDAKILSFGIVGAPTEAGTGTTIKLYWSTQSADQCSLALNGTTVASNLPANVAADSGYAFTLPDTTGTASFVLSTYYNQQYVGSSNPVLLSVVFQFKVVPILSSNYLFLYSVSPDGSLLAALEEDAILLISTENNQIATTIDSSAPTFGQPMRLTFNHDSTRIYAIELPLMSLEGPRYIASFDCSSGQMLSQSSAAYYTNMVSGSALTSMIVAATATGKYLGFGVITSLSVLDPSNLSVVKSISTPRTIWLDPTNQSQAASPQGDLILFCGNASSGIYSYQPSSNTFSGPLFRELAPSVVAFSADGSRYFIANNTDSEISVVDASNNQVIGKIMLPAPVKQTPLVFPRLQYTMVAAPDGINFFALLNNDTLAWIKLDSMEVFLCSAGFSNIFTIATVMKSTGLYLYTLSDSEMGFATVPDL